MRDGALDGPQALVDRQAEDEGLWFPNGTASEAYLQQELRKLHAAIECLPPCACGGEEPIAGMDMFLPIAAVEGRPFKEWLRALSKERAGVEGTLTHKLFHPVRVLIFRVLPAEVPDDA